MKYQKICSGAIATGLLSLAVSSATLAWGPERKTFTMEEPATYPTFNSITNNPTIHDERDFVRVGEINADVTDLKNEIEVIPGKQYLVYIYYHNNASATFNTAEQNRSGVAFETKMSSSFSKVLTPGIKGEITATVSANNSNPGSVWDEAYMTTKTDKVTLRYVEGSAKIYNDWGTNGSVLSTHLFTEEGTYLGLNALDGVILGCEEYHGVVSYVLSAEELGGSIDKTVSKDGENYAEEVEMLPGDEAYFKIAVRNTGDIALTNATVMDQLPEGLTLVEGSVELFANDSTTPDKLSDNLIKTGYNLGTIGTGNTVYIKYKVKADGKFECGKNNLKNLATLVYDSDVKDGDKKEDAADIKIQLGCDPEPVPDPEKEKTCITNPEMEGCQEIPNTGPVEIILAIIIILGIGGGGYYLYRTKKALKKAEDTITSGNTDHPQSEVKDDKPADTSSQKPDNMIK